MATAEQLQQQILALEQLGRQQAEQIAALSQALEQRGAAAAVTPQGNQATDDLAETMSVSDDAERMSSSGEPSNGDARAAAPAVGDSWSRKFWLAVGFSFVNGWIDAVSLVRYGAFGTMMVGNVLYFALHVAYLCADESIRTLEATHGAISPWSLQQDPFYGYIVLLYMAGSMLHAVLAKYQWITGRRCAPFIMASMVAFEMVQYLPDQSAQIGTPHGKMLILILAPVFGFTNSLVVAGRVGRLPWATTNDILSLCSTLVGKPPCTASSEERRRLALPFAMLVSMICGAISGALLDAATKKWRFEFSVISPLLALLLWLNEPLKNARLRAVVPCFGKVAEAETPEAVSVV
ncbi:unnamed protein product [Polarella glacialis]|uniref:Uncharacterized protein n=1 Tax=Polarella glacialis TaxID=89957 RepID=A0A813G142_POLGL|nr:unnamed protein product [Polarella glacialis]